MTRDDFERRLVDAGLKLSLRDREGMFALISGFETLKDRVRPAGRITTAEPAVVFRPGQSSI